MRTSRFILTTIAGTSLSLASLAADLNLELMPPVVVKTVPTAGAEDVDPRLTEIRVTFSKPMQDGSWSWSNVGEESFPETTGKPFYDSDGRTCVLRVKLAPGRVYATWLNSTEFRNFKDTNGEPAVPYLLTFKTAGVGKAKIKQPLASAPLVPDKLLNADQKVVLQWTERQFRGFFDQRDFKVMSDTERAELEAQLLKTLNGQHNKEYYQAINTLGAMGSKKAVTPLLEIASERQEKDCRDRWMAIRALGIIGDKTVVPELIHLVYHGNINTRWTAQIALVQLTGQNFGGDWQAWGKWWNGQGGSPEFKNDFVTWYNDPGYNEPAAATESIAKSDEKFLNDLRR